MTRSSLFTTLFLALGAVASAAAGGSGYTYSQKGDDVRVVISGEGEQNVLVLKGADEDGTHVMKMSSSDGLMTIESEADPNRPWLGVLISQTEEGVRINSVMDGSPAARAGLQPGDLLVEADGRDLTGEPEGGLLDGKQPGDRIRFKVQRDGGTQPMRVRLDSHPGRVEFPVDEEMGPFGIAGSVVEGLGSLRKLEALKGLSVLPLFDCEGEEPCLPTLLQFSQRSKPRLGVKLESLSDQLAGFFRVPEGEGMLITEVNAGSVAERAGLQAGDVLVRIDDTKIATVADIREALSDVHEGQVARIEVVRRGVRESFNAEMDSDPADEQPSVFSISPGFDLKLQGTQGALEWLEKNSGRISGEVMEEVREALAEASREAGPQAAEALRRSKEEARRGLEAALSRARESSTYSEAQRTF